MNVVLSFEGRNLLMNGEKRGILQFFTVSSF